MNRLLPLLLCAAACSKPQAPPQAAEAAPRLEVVTAAGTRAFTMDELRRALPVDTAGVAHDPAYGGRAKRYTGFALDTLLALAGVRAAHGEVLYFVASDGYRATMADPVASPQVKGIVAVADLDVPGGWEPVKHGAKSVSPGPFYLVWSGDSTALRRPWPYQLARIEVVDPRRSFGRIYPTGVAPDDPVARGFRAFAIESHGGDQCVACHSLNRQGGSVGPELNVPRNITEYRDDATLAAFIRDARSFRAGTAMPSFEGKLTDREIADILAYLRWMKGHKVPLDSTGAAR